MTGLADAPVRLPAMPDSLESWKRGWILVEFGSNCSCGFFENHAPDGLRIPIEVPAPTHDMRAAIPVPPGRIRVTLVPAE